MNLVLCLTTLLLRYPSKHMTSKRCRGNVDATSTRRIDVSMTSFQRHVSAGYEFAAISFITFKIPAIYCLPYISRCTSPSILRVPVSGAVNCSVNLIAISHVIVPDECEGCMDWNDLGTWKSKRH